MPSRERHAPRGQSNAGVRQDRAQWVCHQFDEGFAGRVSVRERAQADGLDIADPSVEGKLDPGATVARVQ